MNHRIAISVLLVLSGCGDLPTSPAEDKDSGTETGDGKGSNPGPGGVSGSTAEEVQNPNLKLKTAYYRLFKNEGDSGTCYFLPRPDSTPAAAAECAKKSELSNKLAAADFCTETVEPTKINALDCTFALEASTLINDSLRFDEAGPVLDEAAKVASCGVSICGENPDMKEFCGYYGQRQADAKAGKPVPEIARVDSSDELAVLAQCANVHFGTVDPNAANCEESLPGEGYECLQDCGSPVAKPDDPVPGWSWLSASDARSRRKFGCPI